MNYQTMTWQQLVDARDELWYRMAAIEWEMERRLRIEDDYEGTPQVGTICEEEM